MAGRDTTAAWAIPTSNNAADPAATLYPALAEELAALAGVAEGLQAATGALAAAAAGSASGAHRYDLQNLDLLTQRLHALAGFFAAMPDVERAIGGVSLSDLARRLRGVQAAAETEEPPDALELF